MRKRKKNSLKSIIEKGKLAVKNLPFQVLVKEAIYENYEGEEILRPMLCRTEKYEILEQHKKNRVTTKPHEKKMYGSIDEIRKVLRPIVVVFYNNKYYIIDGQHLYKALVQMGLPIEFYLFEANTEGEMLKVMRVMNSSSRRWGLNQFVKVNTSNDKRKNANDKLFELTEKYKRSVGMTLKVMSAIMFNEANYSENNAVRAITNDYFVQNVPDIRIRQRLDSLKRFYRTTKMTPSNYLNAAYIEMLYDKQDTFFENERDFFASVKAYVHKHNLTCYKYGTRKDAWSLLSAGWKNLKK